MIVSHIFVEGTSRHPDGTKWHIVAALELRDGKIAKEADYFGPSFPAPEWRSRGRTAELTCARTRIIVRWTAGD